MTDLFKHAFNNEDNWLNKNNKNEYVHIFIKMLQDSNFFSSSVDNPLHMDVL